MFCFHGDFLKNGTVCARDAQGLVLLPASRNKRKAGKKPERSGARSSPGLWSEKCFLKSDGHFSAS
jgi:hypothetical protein